MKNKTTRRFRTYGTVRNRVKFSWFPKRITGKTVLVWLEWYRQMRVWTRDAGMLGKRGIFIGILEDGWVKTNHTIEKYHNKPKKKY